MKFMITKTSHYDDELPPIPEAFKEFYTYVDTRNCSKPEDVPAYKNQSTDWWYGAGENHRVVNGNIKRDFKERLGWFVKINTLDDLIKLQQKYDDLIVRSSYSKGNDECLTIEIYDTYRE